jgi:hypothetical protein
MSLRTVKALRAVKTLRVWMKPLTRQGESAARGEKGEALSPSEGLLPSCEATLHLSPRPLPRRGSLGGCAALNSVNQLISQSIIRFSQF